MRRFLLSSTAPEVWSCGLAPNLTEPVAARYRAEGKVRDCGTSDKRQASTILREYEQIVFFTRARAARARAPFLELLLDSKIQCNHF